MQTFKSKQDLWLLTTIYCGVGFSIAVTAFVLSSIVLSSIVSSSVVTFVMLIMLASVIFPLVVISNIRYVVGTDTLVVHAWPFSWRILLGDIQTLRSTCTLMSAPAMSLDRIQIDYGPMKSIVISPKDKNKFLQAIGHTLSQ